MNMKEKFYVKMWGYGNSGVVEVEPLVKTCYEVGNEKYYDEMSKRVIIPVVEDLIRCSSSVEWFNIKVEVYRLTPISYPFSTNNIIQCRYKNEIFNCLLDCVVSVNTKDYKVTKVEYIYDLNSIKDEYND